MSWYMKKGTNYGLTVCSSSNAHEHSLIWATDMRFCLKLPQVLYYMSANSKALMRLCLCTGLPEPLLVASVIRTLFSCAASYLDQSDLLVTCSTAGVPIHQIWLDRAMYYPRYIPDKILNTKKDMNGMQIYSIPLENRWGLITLLCWGIGLLYTIDGSYTEVTDIVRWLFNHYHSLSKFIDIFSFFFFYPENRLWHFMQIVSWGDKNFACNVKAYYPHEMSKVYYPENRLWHFMQIVFWGDNLHEMSKTIFWKIW